MADKQCKNCNHVLCIGINVEDNKKRYECHEGELPKWAGTGLGNCDKYKEKDNVTRLTIGRRGK